MPVKSHATRRTWRDPDDAPELTEDFFARAQEFVGDTPLPPRRGRPPGSQKVSTTIRLDREVVDRLRASGPGWQTRANDILRRSVLRAVRAKPTTRRMTRTRRVSGAR